MQNLLTKLGFEKREIIHVAEDDYPRYAYELTDGDADDFDDDIHSPCLRFQK